MFFYSRLVRGRRKRPDLARLAHQHRMAAAFRSMLARAAALPAEERGAAFVAGYAAHLCPDAEAHPWVLYWTGDITDGTDSPAKTETFRRHGILEVDETVTVIGDRRMFTGLACDDPRPRVAFGPDRDLIWGDAGLA